MTNAEATDYMTLTADAGFAVLPNWTFVRLTGNDRQSFFHNFCTNEIKQLQPGQACEAFVLNSKGKILGYVHALAGADELLLTGHGNQADSLLSHLDKYLIREDVELLDVSDVLSAVFVCGALAQERLGSIAGVGELPPPGKFTAAQIAGTPAKIANIEVAGPGYLLIAAANSTNLIKSNLESGGINECAIDALQIVRVESRTPWFEIDVDDSNLPQELQRDDKAINFNKGCYLGQETVARIDARGRVNQLLVGLEFNGNPPPAGHVMASDGKPAGRITSIVRSPNSGMYIGLGYVRRAFQEPGTEIENAIVNN